MSHRNEAKEQPLRLLIVEDVAADAERMVDCFTRAGLRCQYRCVETRGELLAGLGDFAPMVVLSDYTLPQFDGLSALQACRESAPDVPFVFVSGTLGEERAIAALQAGAADYVLKDNLARLVPAVRRAIEEARVRTERARQQEQIARLNRVLRMLGGVNDLVSRLHDRTELLSETCRLALSVGGYALGVAVTTSRSGASVKAIAADGIDGEVVGQLRADVELAATNEGTLVGKVFRTGRAMVSQQLDGPDAGQLEARLFASGMRSLVALPLVVDAETSAVLLLVVPDPATLGAGELDMLRDLARSLSFGLQYVHRDTRMRFLSYFDPQTGLARRQLFCDRVREQSGACAAGQLVVVMDVRNLSAINDSFGRHVGDQLLRQIADRLKQHAGRQEQLGHFGGGTFAYTTACVAAEVSPATATDLAHQLFAEPFSIGDRPVPVAVRIGYTLAPEDGGDGAVLVQNAEAALHFARAAGHAHLRFDTAVRTRSVGQLALEHRLRFAIERNEFELHYQPKVDVVTRRIQGAEALLRWNSPEDGMVSPSRFLGVLESSGLIAEVGDWVLRQVVSDCREWQAARLPPLRVAVNISPVQLRAHDFEERFLSLVRPWAGRSRGLDIEITESVLQEHSEMEIRKLERLRAAGARIAVDDFGTGYSSLSRLSELPVDTLKIDRRFVQQLDSPRGASLVKTIVDLARAFDMTSVAEGVERQAELDMLWQVGCNQSQGFLHCAPLAAAEFAEVLKHGRGKLVQPPDADAEPEEGAPADAPAATGSPAPVR